MDININPWAILLWIFMLVFGLPIAALGFWIFARRLRNKGKTNTSRIMRFIAIAALVVFALLAVKFAYGRS